jgi:transcriptional regulator with XRE-family HTH domain
MEALKAWMERTGTSQVDFADRLKVSQPTVSDWLNGHITPSVRNLVRISDVTRISIDKLIRPQGRPAKTLAGKGQRAEA